MFPLGSVIFPFTAVPLRVFESRYHALLDRVLADDSTFGSVLIERGTEVGGGDGRFDVGTRLRVVGVTEMAGGHRGIVVAGVGRIRVERWLEDDPHPWAEVSDLPDEAGEPVDESMAVARTLLERVMAIVSELGEDTGAIDLDVADDPATGSFQLAALTPVTPIDAYRLLAAPDPRERVDSAIEMLGEQIELLRASLGQG
jgi:Lon protease-like protein